MQININRNIDSYVKPLNLTLLENIVLSDKGVSDISKVLYFNSDSGSANAVNQSSNSRIEVVNLDSYNQAPLTFL